MRHRTLVNNIIKTVGLTAIEFLGPNPRRKSFMLSPICNPSGQALSAKVFNAGTNQIWTVPDNLIGVQGMMLWGSSGNAGAAGAVLGGGGGGGAGWAWQSGPINTGVGGQFVVNVDTAGNVTQSTIAVVGGAANLLAVNGGGNGVADAAGTGATAVTGTLKRNGGNGAAATALGGAGGGGGGAAGYNAVGGNAAGSVAGTGSGSALTLGYGAGGNGGAGAASGANGNNGVVEGGGGGGAGNNGAATGTGTDGLGVIFYATPTALQAVSISLRPNCVAGQEALNWIPGQPYPVIVTDRDIGDQIGLPWYAISAVDGMLLSITEFLYGEEEDYS